MNEESDPYVEAIERSTAEIARLNEEINELRNRCKELEISRSQQEEIFENERQNLMIEKIKIEKQLYEKDAEIISIKNSEKDNDETIITDLCRALDCISKTELIQKVSDMSNQIFSLQAQLSSVDLIGTTKCINCKKSEEMIGQLQKEIERQHKEYETKLAELTSKYYQPQLGNKNFERDLNEREIQIELKDQEIIALRAENQLHKSQIQSLTSLNEKGNKAVVDLKEEISQLHNDIEELQAHILFYQQRENVISSVSERLVQEVNEQGLYRTDLSRELLSLFDLLTSPENTEVPDITHIVSLMKSQPKAKNNIDHRRIKNYMERYENNTSKLMEKIYEKLCTTENKIDNLHSKMAEVAEELEDKREQIHEFEAEDMAPRVAVLLNEVNQLKEENRMLQNSVPKARNRGPHQF